MTMEVYMSVLKDFLNFSGRSRRRDYWTFTLVNAAISILLNIGAHIVSILGLLGSLFGLVMIIPGIAVAIRRLHDTGRSGWWFLLVFIPIIGWIVLIVFYVQDSDAGQNNYGPSPK